MDVNHFEYLKTLHEDFMSMAKIGNPFIYDFILKINKTAFAVASIFKYQLSDEESLAILFSNTGLIFFPEHSSDIGTVEAKWYFRHILSAERFLEEQGLKNAAQICKLHHETPNGKGPYKEMKLPDVATFICISEKITELTHGVRSVTVEEAIAEVQDRYKGTNVFDCIDISVLSAELKNI